MGLTARNPAPTATAAALLPALLRVRRRWRETRDTWTLELTAADGAPLPAFAPGQFSMLYAFGIGEAPISFSGPAHPDGTWLHTIRAVGPVSRALAGLEPGGMVGARGPFGTAWPVAGARGSDVLFVAGGLGLAPLRPALYAVLTAREHYGRVTLLYGGRGPADLLYRRELDRWRRSLDVDVHLTVDHAGTDWRGHVGVVTSLIRQAVPDAASTVALVCGPEVMMRFALAATAAAGIPAGQVHVSLERNMKCAVAHCGRCQLGPRLLCRDGPVFPGDAVGRLLAIPEL